MRYYLLLFIKGMAIGVANIIPGISGGTIALITKIYEELMILVQTNFEVTRKKLLLQNQSKITN